MPYYLGESVALVVWALLVVAVGTLVYLSVILAFFLLRPIVKVKYERSATEETLLFWGIIGVFALVVHREVADALTHIQEFVFYNAPGMAYHELAFVQGRLLPFYELGLYARFAYIAVWIMLVARFLISIMDNKGTVASVCGIVWGAVIVFVIMLPIAFVSHAQFSLHRIWAVFLVVIFVYLLRTTRLVLHRLKPTGEDETSQEITVYANTMDDLIVGLLTLATFVATMAMAIVPVVYVVRNWELIRAVGL